MLEEIKKFVKNASETELAELALAMSTLNVSNRNMSKAKEFADDIINKENKKKEIFKSFIESSSINGLIYAPTQVGKSAATIKFIETCFYYDVPVIVSTDNKNDQQEQLYYRIRDTLILNEPILVKASDSTFTRTIEKCIKEKTNNFIIFCLDNSSQIEKVTNLLSCLYTKYSKIPHINKIAIIHDEADTVTKDKNTEVINTEQPTSHQKWLQLHSIINNNMPTIDLKRIFVTATPENCVILYNIECPDVMRLEIPNNYIGYKQIAHLPLKNSDNVLSLMTKEVNRIKKDKTFEAILYCVERKIRDGQDDILYILSDKLDCVVNTYNGNGIIAYIPPKFEDLFRDTLDNLSIDYSEDEYYFHMPDIAIRTFYSIVKEAGENCIVTIGRDLIYRGISYVGEDEHEPITATTMFYKPGMKMHNVGICQTIGRITGCAMSNLKRRLYCSEDVYNNYISYNKNQEMYMKTIQSRSDNEVTKNVIDKLSFKKITRPIDRANLKLKINFEDSDSDSDSDSVIDGVKLSSIRRWVSENKLVGKILLALYYNEDKMTLKEISKEIKYTKSLSELESNIKNACGTKTKYGKLWNKRTENVTLNKNIKKYIDEHPDLLD